MWQQDINLEHEQFDGRDEEFANQPHSPVSSITNDAI